MSLLPDDIDVLWVAMLWLASTLAVGVRVLRTHRRQAADLDTANNRLLQVSAEGMLHLAEARAARKIAENASRAKSDFLANMSHELRTPMNSIMGFTKHLIRELEGQIDDRDLDALQTVDRNANQLLQLIDSLLDLSKVEAGRMELHFGRFDLAATVAQAHAKLVPMADSKGLEFELSLPEAAELGICADEAKCLQMVMNLASNAIRYTDSGRVSVALSEFEDAELGPVAKVAVRDTGVGIREEDLDRIFLRFGQVDASRTRKVGGAGLGLVITKHFAELHGGRLDVESEFGSGSEFTITLPLAQRKAAAQP